MSELKTMLEFKIVLAQFKIMIGGCMVTGSTGRSGPCVLPVPNRVLWLSAIWAGRAAGSKTKIKEASGRSLKLCSDSEWNFGEL